MTATSSNPDSHAQMPASVDSSATPPISQTNLPLLFVGSGDWGTATGAITTYRFDSKSGALTQQSRVQAGGLLSFLASDSQHRFVYAADEEQKLLRSFALDATSGSLTPLTTRATDSGAVYVRLTKDDGHLLAAQFNGGKTEAFTLDGKGGFSALTASVASGAESHSVYLSEDERFAFVPGRASDKVTQFTFDAKSGKLTPHGAVAEAKGAGCRHMAFAPNNSHGYLVNEFSNTVSVFDYTAQTGKLQRLQNLSTLPAGFAGKSSAADVHVHPSGRFLYVTNRPADADGLLATFRIAADGKLSLLGHVSTEGKVPRNFVVSADGSRLVVGNQESKSIITFAIDAETGALTKIATVSVDVKPFFVAFLTE
jgi:6-phosphogluconolactonase